MVVQNDDSDLRSITEKIVGRLGNLGFSTCFEDDAGGFRVFFSKSDSLREEAFHSLAFALFALKGERGESKGVEFHAMFFTRRGQRIQRSLSKDNFQKLKGYLEETIFKPCEITVYEFDPPRRDYSHGRVNPHLYPGNAAGVEIHIGGWIGCGGHLPGKKSDRNAREIYSP